MNWLQPLRRREPRQHRHTMQKWDREYREGRWNRLGDLSELAHFAVLGGYVRTLTPAGGSILDVGCGEGLLLPHVSVHVKHYLGIDVAAAVERATLRGAARTPAAEFHVADMNAFTPRGFYDAIAFCESIYYLNDCKIGLRRYLDSLTPDGLMFVSCHARRKHDYIWRALDDVCESIDAVQVRNRYGVAWNVRAMRPKRIAA